MDWQQLGWQSFLSCVIVSDDAWTGRDDKVIVTER